MDHVKRRVWAEIDLDALAYNFNKLRAHLSPKTRLCCVIMANAYGHGAAELGRKLQELECDMLAVACLDEAFELRRVGVTLPILCLGHTAPRFAHLLLECGVSQMVADLRSAQALSDAAVAAGKTLYLRFPGLDSREFEHARLVFTMFPGKSPVKMRMADTGKLLGTQCMIHDALVQEMKEVLGEENVVVK